MENSKPHWTTRPGAMLAAALAASFLAYLLGVAAALPLTLANSSVSAVAADVLVAAISALQLCVAPGVALLFYWLVRRMQRRNGAAEVVSWKIGIAFWVGLALAVPGALLYGFTPNALPQALPGLLSPFSAGFAQALFFVLLFPAAQRRFGAVKAALLIAAAFTALSLVESVFLRAASMMLNRLQYDEELFPPALIWHGIATSLVSGLLLNMALNMARAALTLSAARRVPGTWMLFSSVPWLISLLNGMLVSSVPRNVGLSSWMTVLCIGFPYSLLVFLLSLAAVAGLRRWRTFEAFASDVREFLRKAKRTQNDAGD